MKIKLLDENCRPYKKYTSDAGWDLKARIDAEIVIHPKGIVTVPIGVCVEIPEGFVGDIRPRSGLAKKGIVAQYGTVDAPYRGEIQVTLVNVGDASYTILPYERVAQLVVLPIFLESLEEVDSLTESDRGDSGFGSTGKF